MASRSWSEPSLLSTRRHALRDGRAAPGYAGHVPGVRVEDNPGVTFARSLEAGKAARSRATFDAQALRLGRADAERRNRSVGTPTRQPLYDARGIGMPAAGDTFHSRVPSCEEEKTHFNSDHGLTSMAHEQRGNAWRLRGLGSAARSVPGCMVHVPGKVSENIVGVPWSRTTALSLDAHLSAKAAAPRWGLLTQGGTLVPAKSSDAPGETHIKNPSYQGSGGWSTCEFTGSHVDAAGRKAPRDRQEAYGGQLPPAPTFIHGYAGWVPGRVGENVVGERQCKTNDIAGHLQNKASIRIVQR